MPAKANKLAVSPKARSAKKPAFDSSALTKKLLAEVSDRAREVLTLRFGLGTKAERETLEAIGERWSITRERVRQIEVAAMRKLRAFISVEEETAPDIVKKMDDQITAAKKRSALRVKR